jgi:hypothetical protein
MPPLDPFTLRMIGIGVTAAFAAVVAIAIVALAFVIHHGV